VLVTVGYTTGDPIAGYSPILDGWRPGAAQQRVDLDLPDELGKLSDLRLAAAVFLATNVTDPLFLAGNLPAWTVHAAFETQGPGPRAVTVGDTVTVHDRTLECLRRGWAEVPDRGETNA
jgi:hypothetical protein